VEQTDIKLRLGDLADNAKEITDLAQALTDAVIYSPNEADIYEGAFVILFRLMREHQKALENLMNKVTVVKPSS
jgi:hypothetical protein